jgi:hypothetical protein
MNRDSLPIAEPIAQLQRELDQFRRTHPRRTKLPEPLWQSATELARHHGLYSVAQPLRLDCTRLKNRLNGVPVAQKKAAKPAFAELIAPARAEPEECVIEFEGVGRSKMRIQWKSAVPPDWTSLLRAWRDAER